MSVYLYHTKPAASRAHSPAVAMHLVVTPSERDAIRQAMKPAARIERALASPQFDLREAWESLATVRAAIEAAREAAAAERAERVERLRAGTLLAGQENGGRFTEGRVASRRRTVSSELRNAQIAMSLTPEQHDLITRRADRLRLTQSDFLRSMLLGLSMTDVRPHVRREIREAQLEAAIAYREDDV